MYHLVGGKRIWYIIDFGFAWYGGDKYNTTSNGKYSLYPPGPQNCPYGFTPDYIKGGGTWHTWSEEKVGTADWPYTGWSRVAPPMPTPDWDLLSLTYYVWKLENLGPRTSPQAESQGKAPGFDGSEYGFQHRLLDHCMASGKVKPFADYVAGQTPGKFWGYYTNTIAAQPGKTNLKWSITLPNGMIMLFPGKERSDPNDTGEYPDS